jgi:DNA-binding FadR family transcriptional regulator
MREQIRILERDKLLLFQTGGGLQIIKRKTPELLEDESSLVQDTTVKPDEAGDACSLCRRSRFKLHELSR